MHWITENKEWLFSGVAVAVPLAVIGWFLARAKRNAKRTSEKRIEQRQKSGSGSINIQVGRDISVNGKRKKRNE
jgi:type VI protein secretion system component VasK